MWQKDWDVAEYENSMGCAQRNQEADFKIVWFGSWQWENSHTPGVQGSALHYDRKVKGYFWYFL